MDFISLSNVSGNRTRSVAHALSITINGKHALCETSRMSQWKQNRDDSAPEPVRRIAWANLRTSQVIFTAVVTPPEPFAQTRGLLAGAFGVVTKRHACAVGAFSLHEGREEDCD